MKQFEEQPKIKKEIYRGRIHDEDVSGWMQALREGGFSNEEIDLMFEGLNQKYAEQKLPKEIRELWDQRVKAIERKRGFEMSEKEKEKLFNDFLNLTKHHREIKEHN